MEENKKSSYRGIMKGTAIFGGVQVFNILINVIRGKLVAFLLGPEGMGISALFVSTTNIITQFTGFGLQLSSIKDISQAYERHDRYALSRTAKIFQRLMILTGGIAALISLLGASWLSTFTFGTDEYSWGFIALSIMLFFSSISTAETTILQGTRQLKSLAKSSMFGAVGGLLIGVPLYYFLGVDGIVPAMVVAAITTYIINRSYCNRLNLDNPKLGFKEVVHEGRNMMSLGVVMMISTLIGAIVLYLINVFIRRYGNAADVGLYQAASSITNQYVGLVFSAMAVDYLPRLAAISTDNIKVRDIVTNQLEIVMLVVTPLVIGIIVTAPLVVRLLLTQDFLPIVELLRLMGVGLFLKAFIYPIGYISFSKGDKKVFFWMDGVVSNQITLILSLLGYCFYGLNGLGIAFIIANVLGIIVLLSVVYWRYNFRLSYELFPMLGGLGSFVVVAYTCFELLGESILSYVLGVILLIVVCIYSLVMLDKMLSIKEWFILKYMRKGNE